MKPYIVDIIDESNITDDVKHKISSDVPNSLESSIRDTQLIQPHNIKPVVKYMFKDDLKDTKYSNETIVGEVSQLGGDIKKIIILDIDNDEVQNTAQYNLSDKDVNQISHIEVSESKTANSKVVMIGTVDSNLKGLESISPKLGQTSSLHLIEIFDNRNKQLLEILDYNR